MRLLQGIAAEPSLALRWICDRDRARLAAAAESEAAQSTAARPTARWNDVLAATDVRAVVVAVAPEANGELALEALQAGKHVLVEKPFATQLELGRRIVSEAAQRGLVAGVGHILRYHSAFQAIDRLLESGDIGAARGFVSQRLGPHRKRALSPWWVLAPHDLSLAAAWLGPGTCELHTEGERIDVALHFRGGSLGRLYLGAHELRRRRLVLLAERALVTVDEAEPRGGVVSHAVSRREGSRALDLLHRFSEVPFCELDHALDELLARLPSRSVPVPARDALRAELAAFSASVRGTSELPTSARASLPVLEMLVDGQERSTRGSCRTAASGTETRPALLESHGGL